MMPEHSIVIKINACSPSYGSWLEILSFIKHNQLKVNLFMNKLELHDFNLQLNQLDKWQKRNDRNSRCNIIHKGILWLLPDLKDNNCLKKNDDLCHGER
jgi:hypothetical protein